ncbi:MAG: hypothetical protein KDD27_16595, partial [Saprospiraceae bacterium]|nr:hypothetical protein [Saprospiraceae bacterium]
IKQKFEQVLSEAALAEGLLCSPQVPLRSTLAQTMVFLQRLVDGKFATDWKTCASRYPVIVTNPKY